MKIMALLGSSQIEVCTLLSGAATL